MKGKHWLFVLSTALLMCVAVLLVVMTRINEARSNLAHSSPAAYNYLLQSTHNVGSFVDALHDFRIARDAGNDAEELHRQYRRKFDVLWGGFTIFEINFRIRPEQQVLVTELIDHATDYLSKNEHLMLPGHLLSDTEITGLIRGARSISAKLVTVGHEYFIYAGQLNDLWKKKLQRLYYSFWVSLVLLLLTGALLTTLLLRSNRQSAALVDRSFKTQRKMKRLIDELRSGKLENKAKDSFIAAASHDLRQPLHALGLFLGATEKHIDSELGQQALAEAKNCAAELNKLFNSLLDLSRLDAGVVEVAKADFKMEGLLRVIEQEFSAQASQVGICLNVGSCSEYVYSDALILNRILRNFLENAIAHSGASEIRISSALKAGFVRLTVADNGCGIPVEEHVQIFSEYYQLKHPERDRSKGLGLGLSIVNRLCELLDVDITLESRTGAGTQFHLDLPQGMPLSLPNKKSAPPSLINSPLLKGALIGVIDDDSSICRGMVAILESMNFDVIAAESAELLIDECMASELRPDLLLVDYRLRENQTGDMAIQHVRAAFAADFPAIVITGDTLPARMIEAAKSGFELLHKPVEPADLIERISALLVKTNAPSVQSKTSHPTPGPDLH